MKKQKTQAALLALILVLITVTAAVVLVVILLNRYFPGLWEAFSHADSAGIQACISNQDKLHMAGLMWLLTYVQVLSIVLPAMPVQLAAGMMLDSAVGFAVCYTASVAANMTAFYIACRAASLIRCLAEEHRRVGKLFARLAIREHRTYYLIMVLLLPGLPNGAVPYAAVNSGVKPGRFLTALLIALTVPTFMTCAAGSVAVSSGIGYSTCMLLFLYGLVFFLYWMRDRLPDLLKRAVEWPGKHR